MSRHPTTPADVASRIQAGRYIPTARSMARLLGALQASGLDIMQRMRVTAQYMHSYQLPH
jgi:hypothetical protein